MAKGRMISKSISTSEKLASLYDIPMSSIGIPNGAEFCSLLFTWINLHTDDYGQLSAKPRSIKLLVMPASLRSIQEFKKALEILREIKLIKIHPGAQVLRIIDFEEHQKFRSDRPKINDFPDCHTNGIPWYDNDIPLTTPSKEKLREVKLSKDNTPPVGGDGFKKFWKAYPNKKSKGQAEKAWKKIKPRKQLLATMLAKIEQAKTSAEWTKDGGQYIPYPAKWLRAKGWEDEYTPLPKKAKPTPNQPEEAPQPPPIKSESPAAKEIWDKALAEIEGKISPESFANWFQGTVGVWLDEGGELGIATRNPSAGAWVNQDYSELMHDVLGGREYDFVAVK